MTPEKVPWPVLLVRFGVSEKRVSPKVLNAGMRELELFQPTAKERLKGFDAGSLRPHQYDGDARFVAHQDCDRRLWIINALGVCRRGGTESVSEDARIAVEVGDECYSRSACAFGWRCNRRGLLNVH
jgi:hypothetical protein